MQLQQIIRKFIQHKQESLNGFNIDKIGYYIYYIGSEKLGRCWRRVQIFRKDYRRLRICSIPVFCFLWNCKLINSEIFMRNNLVKYMV